MAKPIDRQALAPSLIATSKRYMSAARSLLDDGIVEAASFCACNAFEAAGSALFTDDGSYTYSENQSHDDRLDAILVIAHRHSVGTDVAGVTD